MPRGRTEQARGRGGPSGLLAPDQLKTNALREQGGLGCISVSVHVTVCTFKHRPLAGGQAKDIGQHHSNSNATRGQWPQQNSRWLLNLLWLWSPQFVSYTESFNNTKIQLWFEEPRCQSRQLTRKPLSPNGPVMFYFVVLSESQLAGKLHRPGAIFHIESPGRKTPTTPLSDSTCPSARTSRHRYR